MKGIRMFSIVSLAAVTLAACAAPAPRVVEVTREVEKVVEATTIVETTKIVEVTPAPIPVTVIKVTSTNGPDENSGTQLARHQLLLYGFEKLRPDVVIEANPSPFDAATFPARLAAGTVEDTYLVAFTEPQSMIAGQLAADITDLLSQWEGYASFNPGVLQIVQDAGGRVYGLPVNGYAIGLLYSRKLFQEAGLDPAKPPATWDELRATAKTIKEKTGKFGFQFMPSGGEGGWLFTAIAYSYGGTMMEQKDGKWIATYNSDAIVKALQTIKDMYWVDETVKLVPGGVEAATALTNGDAAMHIKAPDLLFWMHDNLKAAVEDFGQGPMPQDAANTTPATLTGGAAWMFSPKAAPEVLQAAVEWSLYRDFDLGTYELDLKTKKERGELVGIPSLPLFTGDYQAKRDEILKRYINVPLENFAPYVSATHIAMKPEPPKEAQKLYTELASVLEAVVSDENADVKALLDASVKTFQAQVLDQAQ